MPPSSPQPPPLHPARTAATDVARRLAHAGHVALFAGGCVRDRLRGEEPKDYDIATDATPERIRELFPRARGVGEAFGVMLVHRSGHTIEVATFRSDGTYSDGRRPDSVRFGTPEEDARRRDFTINGLFEDPLDGTVVDHVGGQADLQAGIVRAIGDPEARLREDRLRMLRAVRFAARFGFALDGATRAVIERDAAALAGVSRERIGQELRRMLADAGRGRAVELLEATGLDAAVLDEAGRGGGDDHRVRALAPDSAFETALAAWAIDRHGRSAIEDAPRLVSRWTAALVLSNAERIGVESILASRGDLEAWNTLAVARQKRLASRRGFEAALALLAIDEPVRALTIGDRVRELDAAGGLAPPPLLDGNDLIHRLGLEPGPRFRAILDAVYDEQLEGRLSDADQALDAARRLAQEA